MRWVSIFGTSKCRTVNISEFWILKQRKLFLFLYSFQLFEHSNYMITFTRKIENLWNFDSFLHSIILNICYFSKFNNFRNLMIFGIIKFRKFLEFFKLRIF